MAPNRPIGTPVRAIVISLPASLSPYYHPVLVPLYTSCLRCITLALSLDGKPWWCSLRWRKIAKMEEKIKKERRARRRERDKASGCWICSTSLFLYSTHPSPVLPLSAVIQGLVIKSRATLPLDRLFYLQYLLHFHIHACRKGPECFSSPYSEQHSRRRTMFGF